ncbi:hypothetical protein SBA1_1390008 [Candidatus Sulfotelmatobacter kueseliae]|uniref:Uncharacterized protein n=1 Tax=Candidatus Sulfotelmatobacter kueseliae TaxID=2042962 RepID=A0A2U3K5Y9_9BACT|nr:hypothetical protein SBA1_1390008 [Candidatus Sulfotelmatobacter kueseliae]
MVTGFLGGVGRQKAKPDAYGFVESLSAFYGVEQVRAKLRIGWAFRFPAFLLWATVAAGAQGPRGLAVVDVSPIPGQHNQGGGLAVRVPVKCSPGGELFLEFVGGGVEPGVSVVSEDRQHIFRFDLTRGIGLEKAVLEDFAPGSSHDLFLLFSHLASGNTTPRGPVDHLIVRVKEGASTSVTKLDLGSGFELRQIALLGSDHFVVSGFLSGQRLHPESFTAIFDASGQFLQKLTLTGDLNVESQSPNVTGKNPSDPAEMARAETTAVGWLESSSLQTADDGSVYLARSDPQGPVFIISPGGAVQRVMLSAPETGADLSSVKIAGGKIAAEYNVPGPAEEHRKHLLTVTDLSTGQLLDTVAYQGSEFTGVGLVCYRSQSFEFLTYGTDGKLKVVRAVSH